MDPIQIEKLQAMKRYRGKQLLPTFIQYCQTAVMLGLFLSSPLWLPSMFSSTKKFFLVSLPNIGAIIFRPKCLFIISNIIIIFLIGESKLSKSTPEHDIYEEYMARRQSLQSSSSGVVKGVESVEEETVNKESVKEEIIEDSFVDPSNGETKEEDEEAENKESVKEEIIEESFVDPSNGEIKEEDEEVEEEEKGGGVEEEEVMEKECEELDEEEEMSLPAEELNRRVEDFIAKFNMQRRLEARILVCYG
ncbi:hypothetical protein COCNU_scaffold008399G000010 [Cocos nucifera]|nr:hypothetical protein [Cocos nucifera]